MGCSATLQEQAKYNQILHDGKSLENMLEHHPNLLLLGRFRVYAVGHNLWN
jgi:hypothetical protein